MTATQTDPVDPKAFDSGREIRWCPGCGSYFVLSQLKKALANTRQNPDQTVVVSGIGCSSRFPYYINTYGMHGIHGRAPAIATGLKIARPELSVWVITGDGDGLSIGGNHMLHALRRNLDLKVILFNNRIYGLTKGQVSPTSELGKRSPSTPYGSINPPIVPVSFAIASEASFVARSVDRMPQHLEAILERAALHRGLAFIEVYINCVIFNNGAFSYISEKSQHDEHTVELEHGRPLIFGAEKDKGIRLNRLHPEVVRLGEEGVTTDGLLTHDETCEDPSLAFLLSRMTHPEYPDPIGVFRCVDQPAYDQLLDQQVSDVMRKEGKPDLQRLLSGNDTWTVE